MKGIKIILLAVLVFISAAACSQSKTTKVMDDKKVLVVYFSATGTTKKVAEKLANITNAHICEIVPVQAYTSADLNWHNSQSRSSVEMNNSDSRPEIRAINVNVQDYDLIFLGYPIWWDLAPRAVNSFIENNDLTGKTVIPFATSGGSGISGSVSALKKSYPAINWKDGRLLNRADDKNIKSWIDKLKY
ncbi:MAG: flavodoxin [Muribaculaceae bacterium]